ncbi:cysteine desulfurase [Candidatus Nomurabacteria bacterium]|nr:cysteine desulfurase [Candidatus Nomurabacteria bacterium]
MKQIFLDAAAGPRNPSSLHASGVVAKIKLEKARDKVARVLFSQPDEIIFTSGGTEGNNLAIFGLRPRHLIVTELEHASVLEPAATLNATFLKDISSLKESLRRETDLVSIIYAHNETGVILPIREVAKSVRKFRQKNKTHQPYLHIDACQAPRYLDLNVQKLGVDLMTLNGSKLGVPGVGCLFVRRGVSLSPVFLGGGQEKGLRSGTENVEGITRFARALELASKNRNRESKRVAKLRDYFISELLKLPGVKLNGPEGEWRLANNVNVSFDGLLGEQIALELDAKGVAVSTGSACSISARNNSHVIINSVRFSLATETRKKDLDYVLKVLPRILEKLERVRVLNKIIL